jgi:hypothetical protein
MSGMAAKPANKWAAVAFTAVASLVAFAALVAAAAFARAALTAVAVLAAVALTAAWWDPWGPRSSFLLKPLMFTRLMLKRC